MVSAVALCAVGAERVVSNELRKLKLPVLDTAFGRVRFRADIRGLYLALMGLRVADRVLLEAASFPAADFDALFEGVAAVPWEDYIPPGMGLAVAKVRVKNSRLRAVTSIQAVTHKAAAGRLCGALKRTRLPEEGPRAELRVYVEKDQVLVLLDISGEPLFKRGYRGEGGAAPLRETTAAALLFLANWRRKFPLYDPFCGSGTIAIEAAMYAWDMAPGLGRTFALSDLLIGDRGLEQSLREELLHKVDFSRTICIYGSDDDPRVVPMAVSNARRAYELAQGKSPPPPARPAPQFSPADPGMPVFKRLPLKDARVSMFSGFSREGFIITNPPYGRRLGEVESAECLYAEMEGLGRGFPGWKLALITDHPGFESHFGRKADSCREITNGAIRVYFYEYQRL
jgi:putative N6-adenine-specific DNA methylase